MQSNQLVNFANEFDFLPDLARVAAAAVLWRQPGPPAARAGRSVRRGPPGPLSLSRSPAPLSPARGSGRARSPAQGRPRARCSRRRQVGVTLGPALAPAARSAVRESRGAALRSALSPRSRGDGGTGLLRQGSPCHSCPLGPGTESALSPLRAALLFHSPRQGEAGPRED